MICCYDSLCDCHPQRQNNGVLSSSFHGISLVQCFNRVTPKKSTLKICCHGSNVEKMGRCTLLVNSVGVRCISDLNDLVENLTQKELEMTSWNSWRKDECEPSISVSTNWSVPLVCRLLTPNTSS